MQLCDRDDATAGAVDSAPLGMTRLVGWSLFGVLLAAALVQTYAGLALLGLRWDGGPFLQDILTHRAFYSYEPPRLTTQAILELPTLIALNVGVTDLYALSATWSLSLQLAPLLLTCVCYFILPSNHKLLFALPVFHYFAGASSVASSGMLEGPTATAYFWVMFYFVLFASERWSARIALTVMALATLTLHEVMAILGPVLAYAAWWRSGHTAAPLSCLFLRILAVFFVIVAVVHIGNVILPTSVKNRDGFVTQLFGLRWLYTTITGINVPAALGLLAGPAIATLWLSPRHATWIVAAFAAATGLLLASALPTEKFYFPIEQFYARNHPAIVSWPLALIAIAALRCPRGASRLMSIHPGHAIAILLFLAAGGLVVQVATARDWANYVTLYREILTTRTGLITWENLMKELPPKRAELLRRMNFDWTNPSMSLLLSQHGRVQSIVMNPKTAGWQHWDPADPAQWPHSRYFDTEGFPSEGK